MSRARLLTGIVAAFVCVFALPGEAQQYPSRTVKLIVPQTPGGATDVFARKIGQLLSEKSGRRW